MDTAAITVPLLKAGPDQYLAELAELDKQVDLGRDSLPSICCFTTYNAADGVNSMEMARDSTLIAAACDDSAVRVWDM